MRSFVGACLRPLGHIVDYVLILLMALLLCVVTVGMTTHYVVPGWFVWSDELTRFTLVWVTFVGATAALRRSMHIGVDIFVNPFKPSIRRSLNNYRLEGGRFERSSIRNRLSSWSGSPSCSAMDSLTILSVIVPEVTAK